MCGICGIVTKSSSGPDPALLQEMAAQLVHRGPDDQGIVVNGRAGIAARRLSIIDVEGGHQPIANEDETIWCAFNGEIYNHPELIARLRARGHHFRTRCDTEVIVHLYEEYGVDFLSQLDGMFGLVLWDGREETIILGRDRLGIKPLYYADLGDRLLFGSELKALLPAGLPRDLDLTALDAYLTLSYVPAPYTIFARARKLLPGHYLRQRRGRAPETVAYWAVPSVGDDPRQASRSTAELADELRHLLRAAVKRHLISDVPLGAFLSGGLDSSTVVALMAQEAGGAVRTFSVGFDERSYDESPFARVVAERFATDHHEIVPRPDPAVMIDRLAWMYDEPFADSSAIATYCVARLAREHVKVALTGDGGDEIFGGYEAYRADKLRMLYQHLPAGLRADLIPAAVRLLPSSDRKTSLDFKLKRFARSASLSPTEAHVGWRTIFTRDARERLLGQAGDTAIELARFYAEGPSVRHEIDGALRADLLLGLPDDMLTKVDRATMAVSLEARVPLLDRAVVEFMATLPWRYKVHGWTLKYLMKEAVRDLVPPAISRRQKAGFNVPIARWMRTDLRELVLDTLSPASLQGAGVFRAPAVSDMIAEHLSGRVDRGRELWALVMFMLWQRQHGRLTAADGSPGGRTSMAAVAGE